MTNSKKFEQCTCVYPDGFRCQVVPLTGREMCLYHMLVQLFEQASIPNTPQACAVHTSSSSLIATTKRADDRQSTLPKRCRAKRSRSRLWGFALRGNDE